MLFRSKFDNNFFYFNHSFATLESDSGSEAWKTIDKHVCFERLGNTFGVQFHPEKSQIAGLKFLKWLFTDALS